MTEIPATLRRRASERRSGLGRFCRAFGTALLVFGASAGLQGCGLLDASDPTAIEDRELDNAEGVQLLRAAALRALAMATQEGALWSGTMSDEFTLDLPPWATPGVDLRDVELLDRRDGPAFLAEFGVIYGGGIDLDYGTWHEVRRTASVALAKARIYALDPRAKAGELLAWRGFAALRLAEDVCSGFPLHEVVAYEVTHTPPKSTAAVLERALADFDSAVDLASDSARIVNLARVGRARTLLQLGRFADAGTEAAAVPTEYRGMVEYLEGSPVENGALVFGRWGPDGASRSVADRDGGNGLDFVSSHDPRVEVELMWTSIDGTTPMYRMLKYPNTGAPIVMADGIEARLIEAEAALNAGGDWLGMLNALRTTCADPGSCPDPAPAGTGGVADLPPLTDPGSQDARIDLLFRERAFWLFGTGHRLADLRRLVSVYGRSEGEVFPTGAYRYGGTFGTATAIPFPAIREQQYSPAVTGCAAP